MILLILSKNADTQEEVSNQASRMLEKVVLDQILTLGKYQAAELGSRFLAAAKIANSLAGSSVSYRKLHANDIDSREGVIILLQDQLRIHDELIGTYVAYEKNAFDGRDEEFLESLATASDKAGRFVPYVYQINQQLAQEALIGFEDQTVDENGVRAGEYYLCPKETKDSCLTDPYLYPVGGEQVLLSSFVSPILNNGQFLGIAGVDMGLKFIQQLVDDNNNNVYDGIGKMAIVSQRGIVAGYSNKADMLGKKLDAGDDGYWHQLLNEKSTQAKIEVVNGQLHAIIPVIAAGRATGWTVLISLPESVVIAAVAELSQLIEQNGEELAFSSIVSGILCTGIAILIMLWLMNQVLKPLLATVLVLK
ncbi:hypothetical protein A9Q78_02090, partial [Methylophaga sp. 41_12_T18]